MNKIFVIVFGVIIVCMLGIFIILLKNGHIASECAHNKESISKLIDEVWSNGNLGVVDELIAPQYAIRHDPGDQWEGKTLDLPTYKGRVNLSRNAFPDQKFHIEDMICEDNKVAVSWQFTGTQKGNIPGLPATNKKVSFSGITIYYFSNKKIVGHWQVVDRLGLIEKPGVKR